MIDALHARHIPVGDLQVEIAVLQHGQGRRAVVGLRGVVESEITQQILDDAAHGRKSSTTKIFMFLSKTTSLGAGDVSANLSTPADARSRRYRANVPTVPANV